MDKSQLTKDFVELVAKKVADKSAISYPPQYWEHEGVISFGAALVDATMDKSESNGWNAALEEAAKIAEHFENDALTPEEWPPYGLVDKERRFDSGIFASICKRLAAQIRSKKR
jgi:hypothetical protein